MRRVLGGAAILCLGGMIAVGGERCRNELGGKEGTTPLHEEVTIASFDGAKLRGTFSIPEKPKAVLIPVHGSFVQTRDGALDGTKKWMFPEGVPGRRLFAELAAIVLPKGYATLRYDKRASGESEGVYEATDMTVLAKDLGAAIAYARKRLPGVPVGIVAQSEGGLTFVTGWPLGVRPDFAVLQAPALEDFDLQFQFQKTRTAKPFLENPDFARRYPYVVAFYKDWESGALLRAMEKPGDRYTLRLGEWSHETNLEKYRQYRTDGLPVLRKVDVPVVILMGTEDQTVRRVPLDAIVAAKREGAFPNVTVRFLDGLEHSFREYDPNDSLLDAMAKPVSPRYETALLEALGRMAP